MSADVLLPLLDKVKAKGRGRWQACCPAHDDRGPSLSVRELDDGRVLIHCFAGCSALEVMESVGLSIDHLFPERQGSAESLRSERRPFPAADILQCVAFESLVVATAGAALLAGQPFSEEDRNRLVVAVGRIQAAVDAGRFNHE